MPKNHIHALRVSAVFCALHTPLYTSLITGFPSRDLLGESDRHGIVRLLEKPFDLVDRGLVVGIERDGVVRRLLAARIELAGDLASWVELIRGERPDLHVVATGGMGSESGLLGMGVTSVLRKPWRFNDLIEALVH